MIGTTYRVVDDNGEEWNLGLFEGVPVPRHITINGTRYRLVDPASTVVLDPELAGDIGAVTRAMVDAVGHSLTFAVAETVLRSLLPVTTPPEPNGLGAVVGCKYLGLLLLGHDGRWRTCDGDAVTYVNADVMEVYTHGKGCSCGAPDCNGGDQ